MLPTPSLNFQRTPVTLTLTALAAALAIVCELDPERWSYYYNDLRLGIWWQLWQGELWRPITTTLLHGGLIHAFFNVYVTAIFGPTIEEWLGPFRTLLLLAGLAFVSSLSQYAFTTTPHGIVGLSGVVYGLFGFLLVGRRYRSEFAWVCNESTIRLLLAWLVVCIPLTHLGIMRVANVAHFAGLGFGILYALPLFDRPRRFAWLAAGSLASLVVLSTLIYAPWNPHFRHALRIRQLEEQPAELLQLEVELRAPQPPQQAPAEEE